MFIYDNTILNKKHNAKKKPYKKGATVIMDCVIIKDGKKIHVYYERGNQTDYEDDFVLKITQPQSGMSLTSFDQGKIKHLASKSTFTEKIVQFNDEFQFVDDVVYVLSKKENKHKNLKFNIKKSSALHVDAYRKDRIIIFRLPPQIHAQYIGIKQKGKVLCTLNVKRTPSYYVIFDVDDTENLIVYERNRFSVEILKNVFLAFMFTILILLVNLFGIYKSVHFTTIIHVLLVVLLGAFIAIQPPVMNEIIWMPLCLCIFAFVFVIQIIVIKKNNPHGNRKQDQEL
jgi:hypothetical protein